VIKAVLGNIDMRDIFFAALFAYNDWTLTPILFQSNLDKNGIQKVLDERSLEKMINCPHTLYRWKKALEQGAETFLSGKRLKVDSRIKQLEEENRKLKEALAIQTQELMLLKKRMNLV